eukprot:scaffold252020_cov28-Tisochrysis_lutea.AAC.1
MLYKTFSRAKSWATCGSLSGGMAPRACAAYDVIRNLLALAAKQAHEDEYSEYVHSQSNESTGDAYRRIPTMSVMALER